MGRVTFRVLSWVKNRKNSKKINKMQLMCTANPLFLVFFSFFFLPPSPRKCRTINLLSTQRRPSGWSATAEGSLACCPRGVRGGTPQRNKTIVSVSLVSVPMRPHIRDAIRSIQLPVRYNRKSVSENFRSVKSTVSGRCLLLISKS